MVKNEHPCITIATGSCGRAAGADDTVKAFLGELRRLGMNDVTVRQVGCGGMCEMEPLVTVKMPNEDEVIYGKVDAEAARRIVSQHIVSGRILTDQTLQSPVM